MDAPTATCFISYNHADKALATAICDGLKDRGYRVWIDEGELRVGDSLITAISDAIDQVDFLIALVSRHSIESSWCQKEIALAMTGEVGKKGIDVLPCRVDGADMPPTLVDKIYLDVSTSTPGDAVAHLHRAMTQHLAPADPLPPRRRPPRSAPLQPKIPRADETYSPTTEVKMTGIDTNAMTSPRHDGTPGSALYSVPITLSATPDRTWGDLFVHHWDRPSSWTTMHRPGIASVQGNRIILDGTTIDEIEKYHLTTLKLAVSAANDERSHMAAREWAQEQERAKVRRDQERAASEIASRLNFD